LGRQNRLWSFVSIAQHMDPTQLLGRMDPLEIGRRRRTTTPSIKEFPEPLSAKRLESKVAWWIL
jgi:hypothetical protein